MCQRTIDSRSSYRGGVYIAAAAVREYSSVNKRAAGLHTLMKRGVDDDDGAVAQGLEARVEGWRGVAQAFRERE